MILAVVRVLTRQPVPSRITRTVISPNSHDMREGGLLDQAAYEKITLRHLGTKETPQVDPITGEQIRALREQAHMSQAVFARYLNLTVGYISQLERGAKRPTGATLVLLNVIRRKGINAIL